MGRMIVETLLHAILLNQFRTNWGLKKEERQGSRPESTKRNLRRFDARLRCLALGSRCHSDTGSAFSITTWAAGKDARARTVLSCTAYRIA